MSRVDLLPRLKTIGVSHLLQDSNGAPPEPERVLEIIGENSPFVWFAASGGTAGNDLPSEFARGLRDIASRCGYPGENSQKARADFDREAAIWLGSHPSLQSGELLRDDVWAFLTTALLPKIVEWRYPERNHERYAGGVRNTFQRLWMRGVTLDLGEGHADRWVLVRELSEDAMVQIFERAAISSDARLSRAIARSWVDIAGLIGRGRMEDVMRRATIFIRVRNQVIDLAHLDDDDLAAEIAHAFNASIGSETGN
ncbi:hypothetical protein [Sinisalibacter aestuarii]|uniref:DUF4942 domain-containing protein n=1 Tax=Sinisalibacter aestuarii TaxID=2949426 RepID=A0ABQ5LSM8_9RHOB|nr:hypothetical protein [Sinisalibacter aestuarii]GKY87415.1 hypothetical protein STA1M1_12840 [Sinisalibacter aestuarii]